MTMRESKSSKGRGGIPGIRAATGAGLTASLVRHCLFLLLAWIPSNFASMASTSHGCAFQLPSIRGLSALTAAPLSPSMYSVKGFHAVSFFRDFHEQESMKSISLHLVEGRHCFTPQVHTSNYKRIASRGNVAGRATMTLQGSIHLTQLNLQPYHLSPEPPAKSKATSGRGKKSVVQAAVLSAPSTGQKAINIHSEILKVKARADKKPLREVFRDVEDTVQSAKKRTTLVQATPQHMMTPSKNEKEYARDEFQNADIAAEAAAVMMEYSPTPDAYSAWHDHAPSSFLQYLHQDEVPAKKGSLKNMQASQLENTMQQNQQGVAQQQQRPAAESQPRKECMCTQPVDGSGELPATKPNGHFFLVGTVQVDVKSFMECVEQFGGREQVTATRQWSEIARQVGIDTKAARHASTSLKRMHILLEIAACKAAGGSTHWRRGQADGSLVLAPFFDLLAKRGMRTTKTRRGAGGKEGVVVVSSSVDALRKDQNMAGDEQECSEEARVEYLVKEVGVPAKQMARVLSLCPQLRHLSVPNNLRPTVRFLVDEAHVPLDKLGKVIACFPQILGLSVDSNLRPMLAYLVNDVGILQDKIGKVLVTRPQLLAQCVERNLAPKIRTLLDVGGVPQGMIGHAVAKQPHMLGLSDVHIRECLDFFTSELNIKPSRVGRMLVNSPQVLGLSIESNLRPKVRFLVEKVGVPPNKIGHVIGTFPNILGYSIENNMLPKLQYLADEVLHVPLRKMGRVVVTCPQLLGYSLEKRIKPRHLLLKKRGMRLSISRMLAPTDQEFRRILRTADKSRKQQQEAEAFAAMSFEQRQELLMDGAAANLPSNVPKDEDGSLIVPLCPKTMSGLYYWHYHHVS